MSETNEIPALKHGDPVMLSTGSPLMVVNSLDGVAVVCIWFQERESIGLSSNDGPFWDGPYTQEFHKDTLVRVEMDNSDVEDDE